MDSNNPMITAERAGAGTRAYGAGEVGTTGPGLGTGGPPGAGRSLVSPHRRWSRRRSDRSEGDPVFTHTHALQYEAKPDGPDPDFARKMQEIA